MGAAGYKIQFENCKCVKRLFAAALVVLCLISAGAVPAYAASGWQVSLNLNQTITGGSPALQATEFTYILTPKSVNAPMPQESSSEGYTFTLAGTVERYIDAVHFSAAGVYTYELRAVSGGSSFVLDQRAYIIEVYAINGQEAVALIYSNGEKMPGISFEHIYGGSPGGDGGGANGGAGGGAGAGSAGGSTGGGGEESVVINVLPEIDPAVVGGAENGTHVDIPSSGDIALGGPDGFVVLPSSLEEAAVGATGGAGKPVAGPKTGDMSNPALWMTLIIISNILLSLIAFAYYKANLQKRRR